MVADVRGPGETGPPAVYMPFMQDETSHVLWGMYLHVRATAGSGDPSHAIRAKMRQLRPGLPVDLKSMDVKLSETLAPRRFALYLLAAFAGLSLLLAAAGIHGVVAFSVSRRRREIGVRMALGAGRQTVVAMVLIEVLRTVSIGLLAGTVGALACARFITSCCMGRERPIRWFFASCVAIMLVVAALAAWLPARQAAAINPLDALRSE